MADHEGYVDFARKSQAASPAAAGAPGTAAVNPLLALHHTAGNQAVQRQLRSGVLSRPAMAGLGQALGNRAVQRLARVGMSQPTSGKGPAEDEGVALAGKAETTDHQLEISRRAISDFQQQTPASEMGTHQRRLLGTPDAGLEASPDPSSTLRRKGKGDAAPAGAPVVGKKTVKGPTTQKYGGFSWTVQWQLDKPSPKGGWIVQKVDSATDIKKADGSKVDGPYKGLHPIWEAWQVNKGQSVTTYAETGDLDDDTYGHTAVAAGTKGTVDVIGSAVFYEGLKLPKSFKVTNAAPTWILPAQKSDPGLTGGSTALAHNISAKWDGVGADGTTTVTTV